MEHWTRRASLVLAGKSAPVVDKFELVVDKSALAAGTESRDTAFAGIRLVVVAGLEHCTEFPAAAVGRWAQSTQVLNSRPGSAHSR